MRTWSVVFGECIKMDLKALAKYVNQTEIKKILKEDDHPNVRALKTMDLWNDDQNTIGTDDTYIERFLLLFHSVGYLSLSLNQPLLCSRSNHKHLRKSPSVFFLEKTIALTILCAIEWMSECVYQYMQKEWFVCAWVHLIRFRFSVHSLEIEHHRRTPLTNQPIKIDFPRRWH